MVLNISGVYIKRQKHQIYLCFKLQLISFLRVHIINRVTREFLSLLPVTIAWTNIFRTSVRRLILPAWDQELLIITLLILNDSRAYWMIIPRQVGLFTRHVLGRFMLNWCGKWCRVTGWSTPSSSYLRPPWPRIYRAGGDGRGGEERRGEIDSTRAAETSPMKEACSKPSCEI